MSSRRGAHCSSCKALDDAWVLDNGALTVVGCGAHCKAVLAVQLDGDFATAVLVASAMR